MRQPLARADHVGPRGVERERMFAGAEDDVAPHPGGEIEDHVDARGADALDDLAIEGHVAGRLAGRGVAHMDMGDRRPRLGRLDRGRRDGFRRHRHAGVPAERVAGSGDGAGDEDFAVHGAISVIREGGRRPGARRAEIVAWPSDEGKRRAGRGRRFRRRGLDASARCAIPAAICFPSRACGAESFPLGFLGRRPRRERRARLGGDWRRRPTPRDEPPFVRRPTMRGLRSPFARRATAQEFLRENFAVVEIRGGKVDAERIA